MHDELTMVRRTALTFLASLTFIYLTLSTQSTIGKNITLGIVVSKTGHRSFGPDTDRVVQHFINEINNNDNYTELKNNDIMFDFLIRDTECSIGIGLYEIVQLVLDQGTGGKHVDAFIGPVCDSVCDSAGLLTSQWDRPMISFRCAGSHLSNRNQYSSFVRVTSAYDNMAFFLEDILNYYGWDRVIIAEGEETIWRDTAAHFQTQLEADNYWVELITIHADEQYLKSHMTHQLENARVYLLCAYGDDILVVLCAAYDLGLLDNEHVFIAVDFDYSSFNASKCETEVITTGLLDITFATSEAINGTLWEYLQTGQEMNHVGFRLMSDAISLYAYAVDRTLSQGYNYTNTSVLMDWMSNTTVKGIYGTFTMDEHASRVSSYVLHNFKDGHYINIAYSTGIGHDSTFLKNVTVTWPGGSTVTPLGRPRCGWNNEYCQVQEGISVYLVAAVVLTSVLLVGGVSVGGFMFYQHKKRKRLLEEMRSMAWKIPFSELDFKVDSKSFQSTIMSRSTMTINKSRKRMSLESESSMIQQMFCKTALHNGSMVSVKAISKSYVAVTPELIKEMNKVRSLKHTNLNPLVGACVDPLHISLITMYCSKGSLQDVLENDNIRLDWIFKLSFAYDIAKGMSYIHGSPVKVHGRLKSSNVLVDKFWSCKVGDIDLPIFRSDEKNVDGEHAQYYKLLWTAPEILREPPDEMRGTQKGDVYSYAIILHEIIQRSPPYGDFSDDPYDTIQRLICHESPPFRPKITSDAGDERILDMMRHCWEEIPMFRPSFSELCHTFKKISTGRQLNLVDQMIHMMEKYADHLEELVGERTQQLAEEQKKTEELLCRMLPRSVAEDLKLGRTISPEEYSSVTLYFSDIVQFTALASESTPFQIVDFLNDLYTCFDTVIDTYDVYKVETIGDAYMVVSGLPEKNGNRHAGEIATMALDLLSSVNTFTIRHRPERQLQLRIGLHTGPVCAGVVGVKMPRYCLFGDTVNYASRMESSGLALRVHMSDACKVALDVLGGFQCESRGPISIKGKGTVETYFLHGKDGFTKDLPDLTKAASLKDHEFK
ncbi:hypothetical protein FSP39_012602 [Pinctada imbricata]|uniref:Guanylate cyclase n=1 Tax=Pinctada imbricata TaxID=66713 RepID=A0AA88YUT6_PINIB|nr:hypothetical protein FSP39_012602 [Pinctada imbricata]